MFKKDDLVRVKTRQIFYDRAFEVGDLCYVNSCTEDVVYVQPVDPPECESDFEWVVLAESLELVERSENNEENTIF